ncbi:MAG: helix-turn-helix domain protein [Bacteriophage sp.]|jgi:transcriptional regulator with XRE-family HTH domain|nr:MAG: helix-turn-helix domain protein [Bacteriophage sp.]
MYIGLKIKELASKEKLTLADLAKRLGKTKQAVYEMVEKEDVNTAILKKLCSEFNVPINYFFEDNSGMSVTANNNSQAVGIGNITRNDGQAEISLLKERIKYLEELLAEKERLIKVYEKMMEVK